MSNKFEQLLDYLVNEEMDKANELFHEIVVEKSREIYENMIAEEVDSEEVDEEYADEDDDTVEEETTLEIGGDATDDMIGDVQDDEAMGMDGEMDDEMDVDMDGDLGDEGEGSEEERISDLEDALAELKSEFEALMADEADEPEHDDMFGDEEDDEDSEDSEDDEEMDDEEESPKEAMREYVEKVSDGHGLEKKGRGETADNTHSPVSSAKGRPTTSASAHNILGGKGGEAGIKGGEGLVGKSKGEFTKGGTHNVNGVKSGIKTLGKVSNGHGAEKKGSGEGSVNDKSIVDRQQ
jgi:hypothetical protein